MKVKYVEFDDSGRVVREQALDLRICGGEEPPVAEVGLPCTVRGDNVSVLIPIRRLVYELRVKGVV